MDDSSPKRRRFSDVGLKRLSSAKLEELFKSPSLDFLVKKRKRHRTDEDSVSLHSVDLGTISSPIKEKKRRRSLSKLSSSLVNILSPSRPVKKAVEAVGGSLTRSLSLKNLMSPQSKKHDKHMDTPYKRPRPSTPKQRRRESEFWHQTVNNFDMENFDGIQIKRQEAIYELFKGEADMIEDLDMVKRTYHDSMKKLGLMSEEELDMIFGHVNTLTPLHQDLVEDLKEQRLPDGTTEFVGQVILDWVPKLEAYITYCSNQVFAKALLDFKKQDPAVEDFLERCQDSPFSRRLDLWSFLDVPRSKLVKYPLLFRAIQKCTPVEHCDYKLLEEAIDTVDDIIKSVDLKAGEAKCKYTKEKLDYLEDKQRSHLIEESTAVLCDGILKNNRGTKLYVFLFEKILVLTRPATRGGKLKYQVYRQPIPVSQMLLEDSDGDSTKMGGSFRSAFTQAGQPAKHMFKVSFMDPSSGQSHTLQANDEHDRKQWTTAIRTVLPPPPTDPPMSRATSKSSLRRQGSSKTSLSRQSGRLSRHSSGSSRRRFSLSRASSSASSNNNSPPSDTCCRQAADGADS